MKSNEDKELIFHNENAVLQIARWSKIVSWVLVVIYLLRFASDLISVFGAGQAVWPEAMLDRVMFIASLLSSLFFGGFYFLMLQAAAQALYLGLDMFLVEEVGEES